MSSTPAANQASRWRSAICANGRRVLGPVPLGHRDDDVGLLPGERRRPSSRSPTSDGARPRAVGGGGSRLLGRVPLTGWRTSGRGRPRRPASSQRRGSSPAPACFTPAASSVRRSSAGSRALPRSVMWFEASESTSIPTRRISPATFGSIVKNVPLSCWVNPATMRALEVVHGDVRVVDHRPDRTDRLAGPHRPDHGPPVPGRAVEAGDPRAIPVYRAVPPFERPVPALALHDGPVAHRRGPGTCRRCSRACGCRPAS